MNLSGKFNSALVRVCVRALSRKVVAQPRSLTVVACRQCHLRNLSSLEKRKLFSWAQQQHLQCHVGIVRFMHSVSRNSQNRGSLTLLSLPLQYRGIGTIGRFISNILKIRYIVLGSVVGGGLTFSQMLEKWKEKLPDLSWISDYVPDVDLEELKSRLRRSHGRFREITAGIADSWTEMTGGIEPRDWLEEKRRQLEEKRRAIAEWLNETTQGDAGAAFGEENEVVNAEIKDENVALLSFNGIQDWDPNSKVVTFPGRQQNIATEVANQIAGRKSESSSNSKDRTSSVPTSADQDERMKQMQNEILEMQLKYQKELEQLEKDNKELRKQLMLKGDMIGKRRKVKRSLIDMYSDVLDTLIDYDSNYNTQDNLPRVVVVGDQSSGKTSVLEMIAQARIFPRGAGEMMTRAPVKVTLSEGPYHIAQFKDSQREFDLNKDSELAELRKEIELRMRNSVADGKTVSSDVIALTVKGPGLPRMVLVDLPGVISTVTTEMARETKDDIVKICRTYMENPNAIILCIQDGSVDAERSNVTELVSKMDPQGKRTILVLTKVDLAEENLTNPDRIKKILEGKLFPMKALGYYAVVTGRGNTQDSIGTIRQYEEKFFAQSRLFHDGVLKPTQMTTRNMSLAVSDTFWKMVKGSVENQADSFKAERFNLETEWKNNFPRTRQQDREELFDRARGEILDEIVNLSQTTPQEWEEALQKKLWDALSQHFFESIYIPASMSDNVGEFNTSIDIKLKHWADEILPKRAVEIGWQTVREKFNKLVEADAHTRDHDVFEPLKAAVLQQAIENHSWDSKAVDYLRVIQLNALEDRILGDKQSWDATLKFMENAVRQRLEQTQALVQEMRGPGFTERWLKWKSPTDIQLQRQTAEGELLNLLFNQPDHSPSLAAEEFIVLRKSLETKGVKVDNEFLREMWHNLYRVHFLERSLRASRECKSFFYQYQRGLGDDSELDCNAVVLFWRVQKMLNATANSLRQQITNNEARHLEKELKEVLEEWSQDPQIKKQYLNDRRVKLAEKIKQVKNIQERLEEFIQALNEEKR